MPASTELHTFRWSAVYAVGDAQVDAEHKGLFALAERFERAMLEGKGKDILLELLVQLVKYAGEHFAQEEALMARSHLDCWSIARSTRVCGGGWKS